MGAESVEGQQTIDQSIDLIFAVIKDQLTSRGLHRDALRAVAEIEAISQGVVTPSQILWQLYQLQDIEAIEAIAARKVRQAQSCVLATKPSTLRGCAALLSHVRGQLKDRQLKKVAAAIASVEATIIKFEVERHK